MIKSLEVEVQKLGIGIGLYDEQNELVESISQEDLPLALGMYASMVKAAIHELIELSGGQLNRDHMKQLTLIAMHEEMDTKRSTIPWKDLDAMEEKLSKSKQPPED